MRFIIITCSIIVAGVSALATDFYPQKKALTQIQKTLKSKNVEITGSINLSSELDNKRIIVYDFKYDSKPDVYYAVFTESMGRHELFDYLVICDSIGKIVQVKVLKYRSEHGGEIASKKWLSQFENYKGGNLRYGDDISAISGATISASSITHDIPEVIRLFKNQFADKK